MRVKIKFLLSWGFEKDAEDTGIGVYGIRISTNKNLNKDCIKGDGIKEKTVSKKPPKEHDFFQKWCVNGDKTKNLIKSPFIHFKQFNSPIFIRAVGSDADFNATIGFA